MDNLNRIFIQTTEVTQSKMNSDFGYLFKLGCVAKVSFFFQL